MTLDGNIPLDQSFLKLWGLVVLSGGQEGKKGWLCAWGKQTPIAHGDVHASGAANAHGDAHVSGAMNACNACGNTCTTGTLNNCDAHGDSCVSRAMRTHAHMCTS